MVGHPGSQDQAARCDGRRARHRRSAQDILNSVSSVQIQLSRCSWPGTFVQQVLSSASGRPTLQAHPEFLLFALKSAGIPLREPLHIRYELAMSSTCCVQAPASLSIAGLGEVRFLRRCAVACLHSRSADWWAPCGLSFDMPALHHSA